MTANPLGFGIGEWNGGAPGRLAARIAQLRNYRLRIQPSKLYKLSLILDIDISFLEIDPSQPEPREFQVSQRICVLMNANPLTTSL